MGKQKLNISITRIASGRTIASEINQDLQFLVLYNFPASYVHLYFLPFLFLLLAFFLPFLTSTLSPRLNSTAQHNTPHHTTLKPSDPPHPIPPRSTQRPRRSRRIRRTYRRRHATRQHHPSSILPATRIHAGGITSATPAANGAGHAGTLCEAAYMGLHVYRRSKRG